MVMQTSKEENSNSLRIIQDAALQMGVFVHKVCEKHDLRYSLFFGSLIGAVRHQGFIPWDDDLDLALPRPDYEKFLDVVVDELPEYYELQNYRVTESVRYVSRIIDLRLPLELDSYGEGNNSVHAWIDLFPIDGIPSGFVARNIHYARINWHKAMCAFAAFDQAVKRKRPGRPIYQQVIINFCIVTHFGAWMDARDELEKYDKALRRYSFDEFETCVCGVGTYHPKKQTWPKTAFTKLIQHPFCSAQLSIPVDYDSVLTKTYGDYRIIPRESDRFPHLVRVGG